MVWLAQALVVGPVVAVAALSEGHDVVHLVHESRAAGMFAVRVSGTVGVHAAAHPHVGLAAGVCAAFEGWAADAWPALWGGLLAAIANAGWCCRHWSPGPETTKPPGLRAAGMGVVAQLGILPGQGVRTWKNSPAPLHLT